jgi:hypothetical protein
MRIKMLKQVRGAREGTVVETFEVGQELDLGATAREQDLLRVLLRERWAEDVRARPAAPENASKGQAPENAMRAGERAAQPLPLEPEEVEDIGPRRRRR